VLKSYRALKKLVDFGLYPKQVPMIEDGTCAAGCSAAAQSKRRYKVAA